MDCLAPSAFFFLIIIYSGRQPQLLNLALTMYKSIIYLLLTYFATNYLGGGLLVN